LNEFADRDTSDDDDSKSTQSVFNKQKTKKIKKQLDEVEIREFVYTFIQTHETLYLQVLNYIPLDIEIVYAQIKEILLPRRANSKLLLKVLDEFCVTFTTKNMTAKTHQGKTKYQKKK